MHVVPSESYLMVSLSTYTTDYGFSGSVSALGSVSQSVTSDVANI